MHIHSMHEGTDGHLKLGDFGLSKIISSVSKERVSDHKNMHLSKDAYDKVRKFLPLKTQPDPPSLRRDVTILLISTVVASEVLSLLELMSIQVLLVSSRKEGISALRQCDDIEAVVVELHPVSESHQPGSWCADSRGVQRLRGFCTDLFNSVPVFVIADCLNESSLSNGMIAAGATDVFPQPLQRSIYSHKSLKETMDILFHGSGDDSAFLLRAPSPPPPPLAGEEKEEKEKEEMEEEKEEEKVGSGVAQPVSDMAGSTLVHPHPHPHAHAHAPRGWLEESSVERDYQDHSAVGTLHFIAPEVITLQKYGKSVDWWACGVTFYECLVREHLFYGDEREKVFNRILEGPIHLAKLQLFGEPVTDLVRGLLNRNVKQRLGTSGTASIKAHELFKEVDWETVSTSDRAFKPAQFVVKKMDLRDKVLLYGTGEEEAVSQGGKTLAVKKTSQSFPHVAVTKSHKSWNNNKKKKKKPSSSSSRRGKNRNSIGFALSAAAQTKRKLLVSGELTIKRSDTTTAPPHRQHSLSSSHLLGSGSFSFNEEVFILSLFLLRRAVSLLLI